jgi:hypothetical protein
VGNRQRRIRESYCVYQGAGSGDGGFRFDNATVRNTVSGNSIAWNGGLGIDVANNGVTPNDANDPDVGPNRFQKFSG